MSDSKTVVQAIAAYRCPLCGGGVLSTPGALNVAKAAGRVTLRCSKPECPASKAPKGDVSQCMDIRFSNENGTDKFTFSVPCIFCRKPHTYTATAELLNNKAAEENSMEFACPVSGITIGLMGERKIVKFQLDKSELELFDALDGGSLESIADMNGDLSQRGVSSYPDPEITDIINFVLRDLEDEGKVYCGCAPDEDGNCTGEYYTEPGPGYITITCEKCGRRKVIEAGSLISANKWLEAESMTLE